MEQKLPDPFVFGSREKSRPEFTCFYIFFHGRVHFSKKFYVTSCLIFCPWNKNTGISPVICRKWEHHLKLPRNLYHGNDHGNPSTLVLLCPQVLQPFVKKTAHVKIIGSCRRKKRNITCPAQTLIPLRTIRRDIYEIGFGTPFNAGLKLIQHRL